MRAILTGGRGYEFLIEPGAPPETARKIGHHRILAWLDYEISTAQLFDPSDDVEIDHVEPIPWLNIPSNLEAVDVAEHAERTRARERRRKA